MYQSLTTQGVDEGERLVDDLLVLAWCVYPFPHCYPRTRAQGGQAYAKRLEVIEVMMCVS